MHIKNKINEINNKKEPIKWKLDYESENRKVLELIKISWSLCLEDINNVNYLKNKLTKIKLEKV